MLALAVASIVVIGLGTPGLAVASIWLRSPSAGISGGFVRHQPPVSADGN